jgi:hypothetical protein
MFSIIRCLRRQRGGALQESDFPRADYWQLPPTLVAGLDVAADANDLSPGQVLRILVREGLERWVEGGGGRVDRWVKRDGAQRPSPAMRAERIG